ncbi:GNAT family N-acetyltransferase [Flavobacterium sp. MC2016-06]|uniref:GNAT family N-acetyltransferase n=1 Tax=Flavobacterium sp. MC2016-06 TaxID=2676308 RepID=UPI0012BAE15D|nr:GNAT family N-acetyltransferase [Flavobacterium sp. MC2016-06]MBU3860555.1 GNAT family N-acetyltransferase [Flavobacterium sp. MC2016-06]
MTASNITIRIASKEDLDGILKIQAENQVSQGGKLSAALKRDLILEMMSDMPQIVAIIDNEVVGFLLTTSKAVNQKNKLAIVDAMSASYSGSENAYIYGPICINRDQRGKGFAQLMFNELLRLEPNREGILFIKDDNEASLKAHEKMGIHKKGSFTFGNNDFSVLAYLFPV